MSHEHWDIFEQKLSVDTFDLIRLPFRDSKQGDTNTTY